MSTKTELVAQQLSGSLNTQKIWGDVVVNVKSYGAKGDGVTDDTAAIQAAISYAISIGKKEILFPPGTYVYGVLTDTANIVAVGDGVTLSGTTALSLTSAAAQLADNALRAINIKYPPAPLVAAACDGETDDTARIQAAVNLIDTNGTILLDNNFISNDSPITIPAGKTIRFQTKRPIICDTVDGNDSGLTTNAQTFIRESNTTVIFDEVVATNTNSQGGVFCDVSPGVTNAKVISIGSKLTGFSTGFGSVGDDSKFIGNDITLRSVVPADSATSTFYGIHTDRTNVVVIGNTIKNGRHHVYLSGTAQAATVMGNRLYSSFWQSIHAFSTDSENPTKDHVISGNSLFTCGTETGNARSSILCAGYFDNILIDGNLIVDHYGYGVKLEGSDVSGATNTIISNNKMRSSQTGCPGGINIRTVNDGYAKGNQFYVIGNPIVVDGGSTNTKVHDNEFIWISGTSALIQLVGITGIDVSGNMCDNLDSSVWYDGSNTTAGIYTSSVSVPFTGKNNVFNNYNVHLVYDGAPLVRKSGVLPNGASIPSVYHFFGDRYENAFPPNGNLIGQICWSSGNPGTFSPYGILGESKLASQADSTATDVAGIVSDFNALLAKIRAAGQM